MIGLNGSMPVLMLFLNLFVFIRNELDGVPSLDVILASLVSQIT